MKKIFTFIIKQPVIVIISILLLTGFFIFQLQYLRIEDDMGKMFPDDHPISQYTKKVKDLFGERANNVLIIIQNENGIFNLESLLKIDRITEKLSNSDDIIESELVSITNIDNIVSSSFGIEIKPFAIHANMTKDDIEKIKHDIFSNELIKGRLVSIDETITIIQVSFEDEKNPKEIFSILQDIIDPEKNPEKIYLAGDCISDYYMSLYMNQDMRTLFPIVLLITFIILFFSFKSVRGIVIPILTVIFSIIWTIGLMAFLRVNMNMMTMMTPIILLPIGCADGIHILSTYFSEARKKTDKKEIIFIIMNKLFLPVVITSITTMAGFAALSISSLPWIQTFGIFTAFGSFFALIISITFIPALLSILKIPKRFKKLTEKQKSSIIEKSFINLGEFVYKNKIIIIIITIIIVIISVIGITMLEIEHDSITFVPEKSKLHSVIKIINEKLGGAYLLNIVVDTNKINGIENTKILTEIETFIKYLEKIEIHGKKMVGHTFSIIDYLKHINFIFNYNDPEFNRLPEKDNVVSDLILLYSISGNPDSLYKLIDSEHKIMNTQVLLTNDNSKNIDQLINKINTYIKNNFDDTKINIQFAGIPVKTAATMKLIISSQVNGLIIAVIVILLCCILAFRSIVGGLLSISDVSLTLLLNFGLLGLLHIPLTMPIIIMSAMVLGVGVDFTIHFLTKYKILYLEKKNNFEQPDLKEITKQAMKTTGIAILFTSISLFLGFLVLLFSIFQPIAIMGALVALTMFTGFCGTILLLASLLNIIKPKFLGRR